MLLNVVKYYPILLDVTMYNELMKQVAVERIIWNYQEFLGKGVPIIILHGWGRSGAEWKMLGEYLQKRTGRPVLIPDLPGFGGTSLVQVEDIYGYTEQLWKWLKYLKIKRASIVGHSLGGRMGVVLGARYPRLVEQLVLIAPAAVKPLTLRRIILTPLRLATRGLPRAWREHLGQAVSDVDGRDEKRRALYKAVVKYDLSQELPHIQAPTLVIWGERDLILPLALLARYKNLLPNVRVRVVWEAGHDPHLTHLRELARIVEEAWI